MSGINQSALLDAADVCGLLRKAVNAAGSQKVFADQIGVRPQYVFAVLRGDRRPSDAMLTAIGLRRVERFTEIGASK
jgi:hypothetical protein